MKLRAFASILVISVVLFGIVGCTLPIPAATIPQGGNSGQAETMTEDAVTESNAMATVATRSLRVRQEPNETSEVIAGIAEGETYRVVGLSSDGQWVQLAIESAPDGAGWVSANFVTVEGDITNLGAGADAGAVTATTPATTTETVTESTPASELTLVPTPQPGFARVSTDGVRLRVRSEPSAEAPIVGYAYDGEIYEVIATSGDGSWIQIPPATGDNTDNPDGGWVAAEFLIVGQ